MLIDDIHNNTFRQKVLYNCIPKITPIKGSKTKDKDTNKPASIERLSPPIPAKTSKEVNKISKFFKPQKPAQSKASPGKLYI